jgi:site-specific DNA-methyltransferase (adenine-specific)
MKKHERQNSVVHLMDCIEGMKQYPDNYFQLAVVDTPYGINVNMNAGRKKDTKSKKREVKKWDSETPSKEYWEQLFRVSENQIVWGANHMTEYLPISQGWIFWDKCVAAGCTFSDGELAWTSYNQSLKKVVVPWSGFIGAEGEKFHPTTKPIKLYDWIFHNYAKCKECDGSGEIASNSIDCDVQTCKKCKGKTFKILDTHLGSQSSRIAAHKHGLDFTGFELDAEYFEKGNKRFDDFISQTTIFDML